MPTVDTVRGPVEADNLGQTLAHEHLISISTEFARFYPEFAWPDGNRSAIVQYVASALQEVRSRGIATIIDCTANMHDRDMDFVKEVNDQVDLNIIISTGFYTEDYLPHHIAYRQPKTTADDILTRMFIRDITQQVADSGVKAQSIKIAVDHPGFTPNIQRIFRAAGKASAETGAPITVHTHAAAQQAQQALDLLTSEGADPSLVVIGHSGNTTDIDYLRSIIKSGAVVGSDRFGLYLLPDTSSEEQRIDAIATLAAEGHADRIVLSHDCVLYSDWGEPTAQMPKELDIWKPTRVSDVVLPALRSRGVSEDDIKALMVDTPASLFARLRS